VGKDPKTKAIILYIEQITGGKGFMDVVSEVAKTKPVIAIKSGSSKRGEHAASSHTGSLSGSYEVYLEAFRKSGVIAVHTLTGAFLAAQMLSHPKGFPKGKRAVVITNAGGFAVLSSDYAERYGVDIIDLLGDATAQRFEKTFEVLAKHSDLWDMAKKILEFSGKTENRLIATLLGGDSMNAGRELLKEHNIPGFEELDFTFRVMGRVLWQKFRVKAPGLL